MASKRPLNIRIRTTERDAFRQILEIMRYPVLSSLTNKEIGVLSQILYYHNKYRDHDPNTRWELVFLTSNRREMAGYLNISQENFDNYISSLRKKDVLKGDRVDEKYLITMDDVKYLLFDIKVQSDTNDREQDEDQQGQQ